MKSKLLFLITAVASVIVAPAFATGQVAPERPPKDLTGPVYKYEVYVGYGYTSLNQVNQSRSGLQGVSGSVTRRFGDHFGLKVDGGHYAWSVTATNAGNPTVDLFLAGPVIRGNLFEKWSAYAEGLLGGAHTGNVTIQPNVSFAGGIGMGVDYNKNARWSIRAFGDDIGSSFTLVPYQPGYSPHTRFNARAGIGLAYHF
ncbi:hypothetical protein P8935_20135 [Telmatobacter sp. DSM 110680]|uniref:Outer membrane protein beta-barrel domain-containing protein n=1 Tax=Telmatobacter sp. DSM 110680 TaxID=3036704 RepID=A0AAU7DHL4_9BACT